MGVGSYPVDSDLVDKFAEEEFDSFDLVLVLEPGLELEPQLELAVFSLTSDIAVAVEHTIAAVAVYKFVVAVYNSDFQKLFVE